MPLSPGEKLGPYEIVAPIGAGGMGEVYRARDTKLKREVALKVLPEAFAGDQERMARFQREAEVPGLAQSPQHRPHLWRRRTGAGDGTGRRRNALQPFVD